MKFSVFTSEDLVYLPEVQPPTWSNLIPRFAKFIQDEHCHPIKLQLGHEMVGIGTTICHENSAWLACIIVHPEHRRKGFGQMITQQLLDSLDKNKYQTIYLVATDLGFPVYQKLGFIEEKKYLHYKNEGIDYSYVPSIQARLYDKSYREAILQLDSELTCENRMDTLMEHLPAAKLYFEANKLTGYYLPTLGEGHILAATTLAGTELLKLKIKDSALYGFPEDNITAQDCVKSVGLQYHATSRRMFLGKKRNWNSECNYSRIGGHLG